MRVTVTALLLTLLLATGVAATEFIETWDDPLGTWRNRWVAMNTNMENIYVCTGSTTDEDTRGNNPCGLWICDGTPDNVCTINFDPGFGGQIRTWELDIQAVAPNITLEVYNTANVVIFNTVLPFDASQPFGCVTNTYTVLTPIGVSKFVLTGSAVEGNTAVDNFRVVQEKPVSVDDEAWGRIKARYLGVTD